MTMSSLYARRLVATGFLFAAVGMLACEGDPATSPDGVQIRAAKPPKDGGGEIIVDSAEPPDGEQGAVGLQIRVLGSGFEKGAKVAFHLSGETDPDAGMTVQSTSFVNSTEVIATTNIALDAVVSSRDISVSFRGRRGIGTEKFHVKVSGKPVETQVDAALEDPATETPGVFSDGSPSAGFADYDGDNTTARFRLIPQCADGRSMSLKNVVVPGVPLANQSTCNGDGGWVFFRLPDLLDIPETCSGQPLEQGQAVDDECPFPKIPSFDFSVKKNGRVTYSAQGAFAPNAQYFVKDLATGERYEFLFQDAHVDVNLAAGSWTFIAHEAHVYKGHQFVCVGVDGGTPPATDSKDPALCKDFPLSIDITVTRNP